MRQIRRGVFETNSSSTHSITICTEDEFNKFIKGEIWFSEWPKKFIKAVSEDMVDMNEAISDAESNYTSSRKPYWKEWKDLTEDEKLPFIMQSKSKLFDIIKDDSDDAYTSYEDYKDRNDDVEHYDEHFNTPGGDKMVAFGYYGYN